MEQSYKEKYEQALAKLRGLIDGIREEKCEIVEDDIIDIFPELAESNDEKIRKALIGELNTYFDKDTKIDGFSIERIIAWLEDQGQHYKFRNGIQIGDKVTRNEDGVLVNLSQLKRVAKPNEKQAEQKSNPVLDIEIPFGAKDSELQEATYYIPKGFHAEIDDDKVVIKQGEHKPLRIVSAKAKEAMYDKPAWSEEDEKMLQGIWDEILANKHDAKEYEWKTYDKFLNWLKSLKDRCIPQSKPTESFDYENANVEQKDFASDIGYPAEWIKNREGNKPPIKHSVLMLTTHGVAEGEWLGEEWCQYRWSCKVKDKDVLCWMHLSGLTKLEKEE